MKENGTKTKERDREQKAKSMLVPRRKQFLKGKWERSAGKYQSKVDTSANTTLYMTQCTVCLSITFSLIKFNTFFHGQPGFVQNLALLYHFYEPSLFQVKFETVNPFSAG